MAGTPRHHLKPIDESFEADLNEFYRDRFAFKGIFIREENKNFYVKLNSKYRGTRKRLADAVTLCDACLAEEVVQ